MVVLLRPWIGEGGYRGVVFNNRSSNALPLTNRSQVMALILPKLGCFKKKAMATYSSTLAWKIPWTEEPGGLQSMGLQRVGHN